MKFKKSMLVLFVITAILVALPLLTSAQETITFVTLEDLVKNMKPVIEEFQHQYPDIKVAIEGYPFNHLFEVIETKMKAGATDIDVFNVDVPMVANYSVKGYLETLDPYFSDDDKAEFLDSAMDAATYMGAFKAAPLNSSSVGMYINSEIFSKYGVEPPSCDPTNRWTWDQVVEAAQKLTVDTNNDGTIDIWGFAIDQFSRPYQMLPFIQSLGGQSISEDGLTSKGYVDSDIWIRVGQFYQDLFHSYKVSPLGVPAFQSPELFKAGKVAMLLTGPWHVNSFNEVSGLEWRYVPHPYFEDGKPVTPTGSWHIGVSANSRNKEAAAAFVKFLTLKEGNRIYFDGDGNLPANIHTLDYAKQKAIDQGNTIMELAIFEAENTSVPRPSTPGYLEWEMIVYQAFEDIRNGADPQYTLQRAAAQIDRELRKYTR